VSLVIPDAIEPVVGWRCFDIVDGLLVSPQQRMPWPPGRKAKATCSNERWSCEWNLRTPKERSELEAKAAAEGFEAATGHYVKFLMPDGEVEQVSVYMPWGLRGGVPPVTYYPTEGHEWVLEVAIHGHPAPHDGCSCGIHLATDISHALQYRGQTQSAAIGICKGWGKVIKGSRAHKVEFSYPERLYLFEQPEGPLDLSPYKIPLASVLECPEYLDTLGIKWR
jgi:hypothetical protein